MSIRPVRRNPVIQPIRPLVEEINSSKGTVSQHTTRALRLTLQQFEQMYLSLGSPQIKYWFYICLGKLEDKRLKTLEQNSIYF